MSAVSTAMKTTTSTMETAAAMESTTMEASATESASAAVEAATYVAAPSTPAAKMASSPTARMTIAPAGMAVTPAMVIPGTSANKDAAVKPLRAIVAHRCTGIGRVGIVAIRADRWLRGNIRVTATELNPK